MHTSLRLSQMSKAFGARGIYSLSWVVWVLFFLLGHREREVGDMPRSCI